MIGVRRTIAPRSARNTQDRNQLGFFIEPKVSGGPADCGVIQFQGKTLHLPIYRWSGDPFASQLSLATWTMTRVTSRGLCHSKH